ARGTLVLAVLAAACSGPPAPDAEVCLDAITRICTPPVCGVAQQTLNYGVDCFSGLAANTGCNADDFAFTAISRQRFLQCRSILLRAGSRSEEHTSDLQSQSNLVCRLL